MVSAVVYVDETKPHLHLNLITVLEGRLCSKRLFDRKALRALQSDFHSVIGKKWVLNRGEIGSTAEHLDTAAFKLKKMKEEAVADVLQQSEAQAVIDEAKKVQDDLEPAKQLLEDYENAKGEKIPFSGKKKDEQIIVLRTKNEQLEREIKVRSQDQSNLYNLLQQAEQKNKTNETANKMLTDIINTYPDEFNALLKKARDKQTRTSPIPVRKNNSG